ncbi:cadherin-like protein 26 isoform X1 [Silurus asotus]|uniref:Cadherin-like protein 26 n=1 Tax=Silurus asotus TaxID=30991 RepID=A0AAD5A9R7_SILAS|nr:cadherin-like protein 26 isoform X1 [Silurus asotus]
MENLANSSGSTTGSGEDTTLRLEEEHNRASMRTINPVMITLFLTCIVIISTQSKTRKKRAWIIDSLTIEEENPGPFPYILDTINVERKYLVRFFLTGPGIDKDPQDVLSINARTGQVFVHKKVDYETHKNLSFKFEARDQNHKLDTNLGVEVKILDINDHAPVFTQNHYETTLVESVPQDSLVIRVSASDKDEPTSPNGTFNFLIDSVTPKTDNVEFYIKQNNTIGEVYFKGCLDYEKAQKYTLLIKAMDNGDKIQLSSTCTVVLNIIDKNNHLPEVTGQTSREQVEKILERWRYTLERRGMKVSETVALSKRQEVELEVAELKMLRCSLGVTTMDRIRNVFVRGTEHVGRFGDNVIEVRLRWFGHVQRRDMGYISRRMLRMETPGRRKRGRFMNVVKEDMLVVGVTEADEEDRGASCTIVCLQLCDNSLGKNHMWLEKSIYTKTIVHIVYHYIFQGPRRIKERESGVEVLRLHVTDKDSPHSPAWRAKFTLHGDPGNNFQIQADPKTNEGILTVIKAMDYEENALRNLTISVENEEPYFYCKVLSRTSGGLWKVDMFPKRSSTTVPVNITVEDVNDPPEFIPPVKKIYIRENTQIGTLIGTFEVIDPDKTSGDTFRFVKGEDKGNWVNIETDTGQIYVAGVMDRESPLVNGAPYTVLVYAEEKGQSPQTGTGTLEIHLIDENDNIPLLVDNKVSMCLSDEKSMTEISAVDVDLPPYSAPFEFELLENDQVEGKWKILKINETTANLVTENTVHTGNYNIWIKILDKQGHGSVQNLSISVCNCTTNPKCGAGSFTAGPNFSAIAIMILAFLLLLAILLMAFPQCVTQKKILILHDDVSGNIIKCNIEMPGTDCEVPFDQLHINKNGVMSEAFSKHSMHKGSTQHSYRLIKNCGMAESMSKNFATHNIEDFNHFSKVLSKQIDQNLHRLQAPEQELCDYEPHCYKYEGDPDEHHDENPDTISIPEIDFHPDILNDLDLRFSSLAAVCRPHLMSSPQNT